MNPHYLMSNFGEEIEYLVLTLTRPKRISYEDYIRCIKANPPAVMIKLAEIQDNLDPTRYREDLEPLYERSRRAKEILEA